MTDSKRPEQPSHADIYARQDMAALVMQRIESKLDALTQTVGFASFDEHGAFIGTGIAGDLGRLKGRVDQRFGTYDRWANRMVGMGSAVVVAAAVIWWLIQHKIEDLLR